MVKYKHVYVTIVQNVHYSSWTDLIWVASGLGVCTSVADLAVMFQFHPVCAAGLWGGNLWTAVSSLWGQRG